MQKPSSHAWGFWRWNTHCRTFNIQILNFVRPSESSTLEELYEGEEGGSIYKQLIKEGHICHHLIYSWSFVLVSFVKSPFDSQLHFYFLLGAQCWLHWCWLHWCWLHWCTCKTYFIAIVKWRADHCKNSLFITPIFALVFLISVDRVKWTISLALDQKFIEQHETWFTAEIETIDKI